MPKHGQLTATLRAPRSCAVLRHQEADTGPSGDLVLFSPAVVEQGLSLKLPDGEYKGPPEQPRRSAGPARLQIERSDEHTR